MAELREENLDAPTEANEELLIDLDGIGIIHPYITLNTFSVRIYYKMWFNYVHAKIIFQFVKKNTSYYGKI